MGIVITTGGISKSFRYFPYDAIYVDANGNVNTSGQGRQVREAWFDGVKYYPEPGATGIIRLAGSVRVNGYSSDDFYLDPTEPYYPDVIEVVAGYDTTAGDTTVKCFGYGNNSVAVELLLPALESISNGAFGSTTLSYAACTTLEKFAAPICTAIGNGAFAQCIALTEVSLPSVTDLSKNASGGAAAYQFYRCTNLETVDMPLLEIVSTTAFGYCTSLTEVDFAHCTQVLAFGFLMCTSLASVDFPLCTYVGQAAFQYDEALADVNLPSCTYVGQQAFEECDALQDIDLPSCVQIDDGAFYSCGLTDISLPLCETVGASAFSYTALVDVTLPECLSVGSIAFYQCASLESISLPKCTQIGAGSGNTYGVFAGCSVLADVNMPELIEVTDNAFRGCPALTSISLPKCQTVGKYAFVARNLTRAYLPECTEIKDYAFYFCTNGLRITVKTGCTFGTNALPYTVSIEYV